MHARTFFHCSSTAVLLHSSSWQLWCCHSLLVLVLPLSLLSGFSASIHLFNNPKALKLCFFDPFPLGSAFSRDACALHGLFCFLHFGFALFRVSARDSYPLRSAYAITSPTCSLVPHMKDVPHPSLLSVITPTPAVLGSSSCWVSRHDYPSITLWYLLKHSIDSVKLLIRISLSFSLRRIHEAILALTTLLQPIRLFWFVTTSLKALSLKNDIGRPGIPQPDHP